MFHIVNVRFQEMLRNWFTATVLCAEIFFCVRIQIKAVIDRWQLLAPTRCNYAISKDKAKLSPADRRTDALLVN